MEYNPMFDLPSAVRTVSSNKWKVLAVAAAVYSMFVAAYFRITPRYTSLAKWISLPETPSLPGLQGFGSLLGANIASSSDDFANYEDIINSTEFLTPLLDKKVFVMATGDSALVRDALNKKIYLKKDQKPEDPADSLARKVSLIGKLRSSINFVSRSPVYQLRINTWDPGLSKSLNTRFIERAEEYNSKERQGKSKRKRRFLEEQLEAFKTALRKSEDNLVDFQQKNIAVQNPALLIQRERLVREVTVNGQLVLEFRKQFELTRADEDNEAVVISVIESPSYAFSKSFPTRGVFLGGGLFSSIVIGIAAFLCLDFIRRLWARI